MAYFRNVLLTLICILPVPVYAGDLDRAEQNIRQVLSALIPDEPVTRVRETPFDNIYEVLMGPNVIYMSGDGRYILRGDLLDLKDRLNLSENERTLARKEIFANLNQDDYIEFGPKNPEHLIYVFTDINCSYCRKLHRDVPELNKNGVGVRYLAFPRGGIHTNAGIIMQSVWCANDRKQALTDAKNGKKIPSKQCDDPVEKEYLLGQKIGVRGTPAIFTADGDELTGYVPPGELIRIVKRQ